MFVGHLGKYGAKVSCYRQVPAIFKIVRGKRFDVAMYHATVHIIAKDKVAGCAAMVCATCSILFYGTPEFGHSHYRQVVLVLTEIQPECGDAVTQVGHIPGEDACICPLVEMRIPPSRF